MLPYLMQNRKLLPSGKTSLSDHPSHPAQEWIEDSNCSSDGVSFGSLFRPWSEIARESVDSCIEM